MMRTLLVFVILALSRPAAAHHSFAMYDPAQIIHIRGKVTSFQWTNPHVMVWVEKDADPAGEVWTIELPTSPGNLARMGWSKHSLKAGDKVDVTVNPLRDGQHAGSFKTATLIESGEVLVASVPGAPGSDAGTATPDGGAAEAAAIDNSCAVVPEAPPPELGAMAPIKKPEASACSLGHGERNDSSASLLLALVGCALLARRSRRRDERVASPG